jgi:hypothetical protein
MWEKLLRKTLQKSRFLNQYYFITFIPSLFQLYPVEKLGPDLGEIITCIEFSCPESRAQSWDFPIGIIDTTKECYSFVVKCESGDAEHAEYACSVLNKAWQATRLMMYRTANTGSMPNWVDTLDQIIQDFNGRACDDYYYGPGIEGGQLRRPSATSRANHVAGTDEEVSEKVSKCSLFCINS